MAKFEIIFDNGGGITLQTPEYVHYFGGMGGAGEAAQCVSLLLDGGSTADWDNNEPECRIVYEADVARNGGYKWSDSDDVVSALATESKDEWLGEISGAAEERFYRKLFALRGFELAEVE
ncbi:MAG: hypothetical protein K2W88_15105 [Pararheinheimera sp.]|nr:hypothetical protein [Rheinheimera sp.]